MDGSVFRAGAEAEACWAPRAGLVSVQRGPACPTQSTRKPREMEQATEGLVEMPPVLCKRSRLVMSGEDRMKKGKRGEE